MFTSCCFLLKHRFVCNRVFLRHCKAHMNCRYLLTKIWELGQHACISCSKQTLWPSTVRLLFCLHFPLILVCTENKTHSPPTNLKGEWRLTSVHWPWFSSDFGKKSTSLQLFYAQSTDLQLNLDPSRLSYVEGQMFSTFPISCLHQSLTKVYLDISERVCNCIIYKHTGKL